MAPPASPPDVGAAKLVYAARAGDVPRCVMYLARGSNPNARDDRGRTALHAAASLEVALLLARHGTRLELKITGTSVTGTSRFPPAERRRLVAAAKAYYTLEAMPPGDRLRETHAPDPARVPHCEACALPFGLMAHTQTHTHTHDLVPACDCV